MVRRRLRGHRSAYGRASDRASLRWFRQLYDSHGFHSEEWNSGPAPGEASGGAGGGEPASGARENPAQAGFLLPDLFCFAARLASIGFSSSGLGAVLEALHRLFLDELD